MLGTWRSHTEYQQSLTDFLKLEAVRNPKSLEAYETSILKFYSMNLDGIKDDFEPRFSTTGRPSNLQPEMHRALVLMSDQKEESIDDWVVTAAASPMFCALIGVAPDKFPGASTLRDFISRLWLEEPPDRLKIPEKKPKEKYGSGKMPPKKPGIIKELADQAIVGATFDDVPERLLQEIFHQVAVIPSIEAGLVENPDKLKTSGDGTDVESHANPRGHKNCDCEGECNCARRFADPEADWGWDSYHKRWFYGYTAYILSTHNSALNLDLPLYLRFETASAFDGVSLIKSLAQARSIWQGSLNIDSFLGDSAHDNYAAYNLLYNWGIKPFIDLNPRGAADPKPKKRLVLSKNGAPVCADGYDMTRWGYDAKRFRIKYRCPLAAGKVASCPYCANCSKSAYGKIVYIRTADDLRLLTPVPRGTDQWKENYNLRTASERVNNRVLTDYELERPKRYGKKKLAFFAFMNAINVHLDAQVKFGGVTIADLIA
jgi:hypothetical protein